MTGFYSFEELFTSQDLKQRMNLQSENIIDIYSEKNEPE